MSPAKVSSQSVRRQLSIARSPHRCGVMSVRPRMNIPFSLAKCCTCESESRMTENVKVCGCRPHEGGAAHTAGPSYANLQGRKPRGVGRGVASDAMGISSLGVRCRGALTTAVGSGRRGGEFGRSIAIAGTGVAQRRLIDESVARGVAPASMVMADRETARQRRNGMSRRTGSGHDVSIPITAGR